MSQALFVFDQLSLCMRDQVCWEWYWPNYYNNSHHAKN